MLRHLAIALLFLAPGPCLASPPMGNGGLPPAPLPSARVLPPEAPSPYPRNYAEEAVRTLGFKNGKMDLFQVAPADSHDKLLPTLSGTLGGEGAMVRLKWQP